MNDCLVGPHVLPRWLAGNHYRVFLFHNLPKLLDRCTAGSQSANVVQHDCAPAHFNCAVRDVLNNAYHDGGIGRGGPTAWPPRSPDLYPLDFYVWGHHTTHVSTAPVDNEEAHRIVDACQTIRNYPGMFARMRRPMMKRVQACTESDGGQFEHLTINTLFQL
jgi:hypothetical protein